jgi:hypothetical protein
MWRRRTGATLIVLFLFTAVGTSIPRDSSESGPGNATPSKVLVEDEELVYNVRYGFIDLGQVKIVTKGKTRGGYNAQATIQSYSGVPFVNLLAIYETTMDSAMYARDFFARTVENGDEQFARYSFQYDKNRVVMELGSRDSVVEHRDTVSLETFYHDGLSLFFYAREHLFSGKMMNIPTFVREKKATTMIDFKGSRKSVETDFIDYPVDVVGFDGKAGFVGVFGLTGDFEGWFSNDDARVPIKATMKVIIGSVTLELVSWKRPGWEPPHGAEE